MADMIDVAIVGGGINGVGVAQAAAARGHSVRLLEKSALAAGTSSRSSKLIHGGLRYLETAQLRLVRESLVERSHLLRNAPDLVHLVPFHIPIYGSTRRRPLHVCLGLSLYALLGGLTSAARFRSLPRDRWDALDGLETRDLQAVFSYYDARTDDAALTRAVMRSAQELGAELIMPARFTGAALDDDAVTVRYESAGHARSFRSRVLVNAAGPWVSQVLSQVAPAVSGPAVDLVRGTHIRIKAGLEHGIYYLESPRDGRAVFVMPRGDGMLVGTTEALYTGDPDAVAPVPAEQHYLLETLRHYFPKFAGLDPARIEGAYAGLRVLPRTDARAFDRPREMICGVDREPRPRLATIYGGKLTTYRATAERVMDRIAASLPAARPRADTRRLPLTPD